MVRSRLMRVGPKFFKRIKRFQDEVEPLVNMRMTSSFITDRIAKVMDESDFIRASKRQARRIGRRRR